MRAIIQKSGRSLQNVEVMKYKERLINSSRLKETKGTGHLNATHNLSYFFALKDITGATGKRSNNRGVATFNFLIFNNCTVVK